MERLRSLAIVLVLAMTAPWIPAGAEGPDHVVITAVYYDTYVTNEGDEFVRLHNPTGAEVSLAQWRLTDGEGNVTFPGTAKLAPGQSIYVTGKAEDFRRDMLFLPDWEYLADTHPDVPQLTRQGSFSLSNTGDEVRLLKPDASVVDAVIWGTSAGSAGWTGAAVPDVGEGVILERDTDELTGSYDDTDTKADWDDWRIWVVGQSRFTLQTFDATAATLYSSPDSSYEEVVAFLEGATETLDLELYEITNPYLGDAILARVQAGVRVRVLMEGGPAGFAQQARYQENWILERIQAAGGDVRFMITNASQGIHDRYDFLHGKFGIADGARVLAMSGNWKYTGVPVDPTYGNREWGVVVDSEGLAGYVTEVFEHDFDAANRDILTFGQGTDWRYLPPPEDFEANYTVPNGTYAPYFPSLRVEAPFQVTPVLSPDTSLLVHSGLRKLLREAKEEILIEQMYAHKHWGPSQTGTPESHPNLLLEEAIAAARENGVKLYVLLGEEFIDDEDTRNNNETVQYLRAIAEAENLTIYAKLLNHRIAELLKVHNKGVIVDREVAVVSSINWGRNSAQDNRELALLLEDRDIAEFYRDIFWYDWSPKENKPITDLTVTSMRLRPAEVPVPPALPAAPAAPPGLPAAPLAPPALPPLPLPGLPAAPPDPLVVAEHPQRHVLEVTIRNVGRYGAGDFNVTVVASPTFHGANETFKAPVNSLARGASLTLRWDWDTLLHAGDFDLLATVDSDNDVRETNEANNTLQAQGNILVSGPGIALERPALPAPPVALPPLPVALPRLPA